MSRSIHRSKVPEASGQPPLELWGGIECTHNRVGDVYFSQLEWNGHLARPDDLEQIAGIGFRALRYPVLWEMAAPDRPDRIDWSFSDERLPRLRDLGIRVIAGLVHHGSGPSYAPLLSPAFAPGLARFARAVAERYPWLDAFTPINEPLTTARFCGLYGLWHPHGKSHKTFLRILIHECRATVLAMQAVRAVNPSAILVQTDDLGRVYHTPRLTEEAEYQNHRRWLGWDLLCGKVDRDHPLHAYLVRNEVTDGDLEWFQENACPPDIIGINHYPTSDRFLDENTNRYPGIVPVENGRQVYADIEAVRVRPELPGGFYERLMEAWQRYRLPLAITESHLGCTREEQLRWLAESWQSAELARQRGADVRAVTAWSLLGAFNWNTLVTRDACYYEPGVFDIRGGTPRATAIASLLSMLARGQKPFHPALEHPGWWQRPDRLFPSHHRGRVASQPNRRNLSAKPILILGARGVLGRAFTEACERRAIPCIALSHADFDVTSTGTFARHLQELQPWAVINAAGYRPISPTWEDEERCFEVNTHSCLRLAEACREEGTQFLGFSSDRVFDGSQPQPYLESDPPSPRCSYGRSKTAMERQVLNACPEALLIRSGTLFEACASSTLITRPLLDLANGVPVAIGENSPRSWAYVPDLVTTALDLLIDRENGIWHLVNDGAMDPAGVLRLMAAACDIRPQRLRIAVETGYPPQRILGTEKGQILRPLEETLACYAAAFAGLLQTQGFRATVAR